MKRGEQVIVTVAKHPVAKPASKSDRDFLARSTQNPSGSNLDRGVTSLFTRATSAVSGLTPKNYRDELKKLNVIVQDLKQEITLIPKKIQQLKDHAEDHVDGGVPNSHAVENAQRMIAEFLEFELEERLRDQQFVHQQFLSQLRITATTT